MATSEISPHIHVRRWEALAPPRAVVQVIHGLAEHGGRYGVLAAQLNAAGYSVYASDHRGHGRTAATREDLGLFAGHDGWQKCIDDLWRVNREIANDHPGLPIFLLAHSMGSFMAQQLISEHGEVFAGVILSATDGPPSPLAKVGRLVARIERLRVGARGQSRLIHALAFGAYNKRFAPTRTPFDWLSRDEAEVDSYMADPLCGFVPKVGLWVDLLDALGNLTSPSRLARIPCRLPIHLISGSRGAVSDDTRGVQKLLAIYRHAKLERVTHRIYPGARHELFHETNRAEVTQDLLTWLDHVVASHPANLNEKLPSGG